MHGQGLGIDQGLFTQPQALLVRNTLGASGEIMDASWPKVLEAALIQDEVELVLQVNGKHRGSILVASTADRAGIERLALDNPNAQKHIAGQAVKKVIVVPGRLVNIVV